MFRISGTLGPAVSAVAAFDQTAAFFFDNVDSAEGFSLLLGGEFVGSHSGINMFLYHLAEFLSHCVACDFTVLLVTGLGGHLCHHNARQAVGDFLQVGLTVLVGK